MSDAVSFFISFVIRSVERLCVWLTPGPTKQLFNSVDTSFDRTPFSNDQVRLRGGDEDLDRAEILIQEFQTENWTLETPVAVDDEASNTPS